MRHCINAHRASALSQDFRSEGSAGAAVDGRSVSGGVLVGVITAFADDLAGCGGAGGVPASVSRLWKTRAVRAYATLKRAARPMMEVTNCIMNVI